MKKVLNAAIKLYVCNTYIDIVNVLNKTHRKCQIANSLRKINFSQLENKIMKSTSVNNVFYHSDIFHCKLELFKILQRKKSTIQMTITICQPFQQSI